MRIVIFVAILAFIGGMYVGGWLEWQDQAASSTPPAVSLRSGSLPQLVPVTVTGYSSTPDQTDSSPFTAAWGDDVRTLRAKGYVTLAVSRDLEALLPPGTVLMVADRLHKRWRRRVDLWFPSRAEATRWGVRRAVLEMER